MSLVKVPRVLCQSSQRVHAAKQPRRLNLTAHKITCQYYYLRTQI